MTTYDLLARPDAGTWRAFLEHWGAQPSRGGGGAPPAPALPVPDMLRELHSAVRRARTNHLVPLDQLEVDDGMVIVYYEEQGVFLWALRAEELSAEDPPVWGCYGDPGDEWTVQAPSLSTFLAEIVVIDAALGGGAFGTHSQVPRAEAERVLAPLAELPWPPWSWPPQEGRFLAGDGAVGFLTCEGQDEAWCSAWVGARDAAALAPFLELATSDHWLWFDDA